MFQQVVWIAPDQMGGCRIDLHASMYGLPVEVKIQNYYNSCEQIAPWIMS